MGREGEKRDISSAPTIRLALNTDREGHEADPTFTAEEAQAGTQGGHRAQVHTHTCAEAKRRKAGRGPLTAACEQG